MEKTLQNLHAPTIISILSLLMGIGFIVQMFVSPLKQNHVRLEESQARLEQNQIRFDGDLKELKGELKEIKALLSKLASKSS